MAVLAATTKKTMEATPNGSFDEIRVLLLGTQKSGKEMILKALLRDSFGIFHHHHQTAGDVNLYRIQQQGAKTSRVLKNVVQMNGCLAIDEMDLELQHSICQLSPGIILSLVEVNGRNNSKNEDYYGILQAWLSSHDWNGIDCIVVATDGDAYNHDSLSPELNCEEKTEEEELACVLGLLQKSWSESFCTTTEEAAAGDGWEDSSGASSSSKQHPPPPPPVIILRNSANGPSLEQEEAAANYVRFWPSSSTTTTAWTEPPPRCAPLGEEGIARHQHQYRVTEIAVCAQNAIIFQSGPSLLEQLEKEQQKYGDGGVKIEKKKTSVGIPDSSSYYREERLGQSNFGEFLAVLAMSIGGLDMQEQKARVKARALAYLQQLQNVVLQHGIAQHMLGVCRRLVACGLGQDEDLIGHVKKRFWNLYDSYEAVAMLAFFTNKDPKELRQAMKELTQYIQIVEDYDWWDELPTVSERLDALRSLLRKEEDAVSSDDDASSMAASDKGSHLDVDGEYDEWVDSMIPFPDADDTLCPTSPMGKEEEDTKEVSLPDNDGIPNDSILESDDEAFADEDDQPDDDSCPASQTTEEDLELPPETYTIPVDPENDLVAVNGGSDDDGGVEDSQSKAEDDGSDPQHKDDEGKHEDAATLSTADLSDDSSTEEDGGNESIRDVKKTRGQVNRASGADSRGHGRVIVRAVRGVLECLRNCLLPRRRKTRQEH